MPPKRTPTTDHAREARLHGWSTIHALAEELWPLAERMSAITPPEQELAPGWTRAGIATLTLDLIEEARKRLKLPLTATVCEVVTAIDAAEKDDRTVFRPDERAHVLAMLEHLTKNPNLL
jgi:hypothetical protein